MSKYDWAKIKQDYVTSDSTYAELKKKYGVSATTFNQMAIKQEFVKSRKKYRKKIETKTLEKLAKHESDKLVEMCKASDNMSAIIADITKSKDYFFKGNDISVFKINGVLDAIDKSTATIRNLYGIRTQKEQDAYDLALEKIRAEQNKLKDNNGNDTSKNGVIYLPKMLDDKEVK